MRCPGCGKSISEAGHCLRCRRKYVRFYINEIKSLLKFYEYEKALAACDKGLGIDPDSSDLAEIKGKISQTLADYKQFYSLAEEKYRQGDYQEAIRFYREASKINPLDQKIKMKMGMTRLSEEAEDALPKPGLRKNAIRPEEWVAVENPFKLNLQALLIGLMLFLALGAVCYRMYSRTRRMRQAEAIFERITTKQNDDTYQERSFMKDYELIVNEFGDTVYATELMQTYKTSYEKVKESFLHDLFLPVDLLAEEVSAAAREKDDAAGGFTPAVREFVDKGAALFENMLYDEAVFFFKKALEISEPREKEIIYRYLAQVKEVLRARKIEYRRLIARGKLLESNYQFLRAIDVYLEALSYEPRGKYALRRIEYIRQAYLRSPRKIFMKKVSFYISLPLEGYIALFKEGERGKEKLLTKYKAAAIEYEQEGNYRKVAKMYKKMWELTRDRQYWDSLMWNLRMMHLQKELKKKEVTPHILSQELFLYWERRWLDKAQGVVEKGLARTITEPERMLWMSWKAEILAAKGSYELAKEIYLDLLEKVSSPYLKAKLGLLYYQQKKFDQARPLLTEVNAKFPYQLSVALALSSLGGNAEGVNPLDAFENKTVGFIVQQQYLNPFSLDSAFVSDAKEAVRQEMEALIEAYFSADRYPEGLRYLNLIE